MIAARETCLQLLHCQNKATYQSSTYKLNYYHYSLACPEILLRFLRQLHQLGSEAQLQHKNIGPLLHYLMFPLPCRWSDARIMSNNVGRVRIFFCAVMQRNRSTLQYFGTRYYSTHKESEIDHMIRTPMNLPIRFLQIENFKIAVSLFILVCPLSFTSMIWHSVFFTTSDQLIAIR